MQSIYHFPASFDSSIEQTRTQTLRDRLSSALLSLRFLFKILNPFLFLPDIESKTLQGVKGELSLEVSGQQRLENTTLDYQKHPDKAVMRIAGPLGADFTVKVRAKGHLIGFPCQPMHSLLEKEFMQSICSLYNLCAVIS